MNETLRDVAEALPEYQTSRGDEFRAIPLEDRERLAAVALTARCQVNASNVDWDSYEYRREIRVKKNRYFYHAGELNIDMKEAQAIWWGYVHGDPSPHERQTKGLI